MPPVSSAQNSRVKLVRQLQRHSKARRGQRQLVLEGVRLVRDVFEAGAAPEFVFFTAEAVQSGGAASDLVAQLGAAGVTCLDVTGELMRDMAETETPQGVLGVFPWPDTPVPDAPELVIVADGWRDPGNLGTLLRTAAAAGVDLVVLTPGTVDAFNPKTLRAGMGAQWRIPVVNWDWDWIAQRLGGLSFYLADAAGETAYDAVDWTRPSAIVVGGEAHGFARAAERIPHTLIRIPMVHSVESLNAATAAAILIYVARQHALSSPR
ncbi:TrmH family RNA methyltransferase [Aggregatilinea lenta]|uniref:TrmH family RNA methyltransferase n=1 Tax=Aggregatilinea lenta TaxID=913108 RepID=UPI000E5BBA3C|nr:RNA methyltransferase [Aggregatilinea lenta]